MYYLIVFLVLVIVIFAYRLYINEKMMQEASETIIDILSKNRQVMSAPEIHYAVSQNDINVSIDDIYRLLDMLVESKLVRCYSRLELDGNERVKSHGTFAIDTISDHGR